MVYPSMTHGMVTSQVLIYFLLTHWGRVKHICLTKLTIIGSDNGLSPGRRQAIIWTNAEILLIGAFGTNVCEILIKIYTFSLKKIYLKMSSGKRQPSCLGLKVLTHLSLGDVAIILKCKFLIHVMDWILGHFQWNYSQVHATELHWWLVNIDSGNGLVSSGNKPWHEPMLTEIYIIVYCQLATMS